MHLCFCRWRVAALLGLLAGLSGCATPSQRDGNAAVNALISERADVPVVADADPATLAQRANELLAQPLTQDHALELALIRSPKMQAEYARIGLVRADLIDASRLSNPRFAWLGKRADGSGERAYTRSLAQNFTELLLLPARRRMADSEYLRTQQDVAQAVLDLALAVEQAWLEAVAAAQVESMRAAIAKAAALSAQLAERFHAAGNLPQLELLLEQAAATQAAIEARRSSALARTARSRLASLLGVRASAAWQLPAKLPAPRASRYDAQQLLAQARAQRLDLAAARIELAMHERAVRLARDWRWLGELELGVEREHDADGARYRGIEATLELPIFQQGQAAIARAQAHRDAASARLADLELAVENELELALDGVQTSLAIAEQYRTQLLPQREGIVDGTQREQNFMFKGAFELLLVKQEQYAAYQAYLEAVRDYWIARAELKRAVGGRLPDDDAPAEDSVGVDTILPTANPEGDDAQHHHHGG